MKNWLIVITLVLSGCASTNKDISSKGDINQLKAITKEKQFNYLECIKDSSLMYVKSDNALSDIAAEAVGKCESFLVDFRSAFFDQISSNRKHNMVELDMELIDETVNNMVETAYNNAIRYIIDARSKSQ